MKKTIRQAVGIDISADSFMAAICSIDEDQNSVILSSKSFANKKLGFNNFLKWTEKFLSRDLDTLFAMEATGVYFEKLAYFLSSEKKKVAVLLPNKVVHFAKTLNVKSKNDAIDAKVIAQFAVERKLDAWSPPSENLRYIKQLLREREELLKEKIQINNQLHSKKAAFQFNSSSMKRAEKRIRFIEKQLGEIMQEIDELLKVDSELNEKVKKITSIKGVGQLTILIILAETNGFALIKNRKQLVSYCGYDVVERQSGTSLNARKRISKKGNKFIRKALHYPALSAIRHDERLGAFYNRINERNKSKMIGVVAVQRKLLLLIYALWKSGEVYNPNLTSGDYEIKASFGISPKEKIVEQAIACSTLDRLRFDNRLKTSFGS